MAVSFTLKDAYLYIDTSYLASANSYDSYTDMSAQFSAHDSQAEMAALVSAGKVAEIRIGTGRITWNAKQTIDYTLNRGNVSPNKGGLATMGDDQPLDVSLECTFEYYTGTNTNPKQLMTKNGTDEDEYTCSPKAVDLYLGIVSNCTDSSNTIFMFPEFRWETMNFDANGGTLSISGKSRTIKPSMRVYTA